MKKLLTIFAAICFFLPPAEGQSLSERNSRKKKIESEISFIDKQLSGLSVKQKSTTRNLSLIQKKIENRRKMLAELDTQILRLEGDISAKSDEMSNLDRKYDSLKIYFEDLVFSAYKVRDSRVWFLHILGSDSPGQAYRRMRYLKSLSATINSNGLKIRGLRDTIELERANLEVRKSEADEIKAVRESEYRKLLKDEKESKLMIGNINRDRKRYETQLALKRKQVKSLNDEMERIMKESVRQNTETKKKKKVIAAESALSGKFGQNIGKLRWPVSSGIITEHFGIHSHPVYRNIKLPENNGLTITTTRNAEVLCVFDGVVKQIIMMPGYNHCVLVQHGSYFTFYCKLKDVCVKTGRTVSEGQVLGSLEDDGRSSTLHFEIWNGTQKQNPELWLRK